jgi:hypothetical protein
MKKVIRLTESDLIRLVRRVINEETDLSSSVKKFELFIDSNLTKSIGTYLFKGANSGMGRVRIEVTPTSKEMYGNGLDEDGVPLENTPSKFPCLKEFSYNVDLKSGQFKPSESYMKRPGQFKPSESYMKRLGVGRIPLDTWGNKGCNVPEVLYTNDDGEDILNFPRNYNLSI